MYECSYNYMIPQYGEKWKLCYTDTDSFLVYIKTEDNYSGVAKCVKTIFDTSSYQLDRPFRNGKNNKVTELMKNKLDGKIMTEFAGLEPKTWSYLTDNSIENKNAKRHKKMCLKEKT